MKLPPLPEDADADAAAPSSTLQPQGGAELDEAPAQDDSAEFEVGRDDDPRLSPDRDRPPTPPAEPAAAGSFVTSQMSPVLPAASSPVRSLSSITRTRAGSDAGASRAGTVNPKP